MHDPQERPSPKQHNAFTGFVQKSAFCRHARKDSKEFMSIRQSASVTELHVI